MKIPTIINSTTNNFDFLRILAAFLVFFGHTILITRSTGILNWDRGLAISAIGVNIFFIISGFLITKSWLDNTDIAFFIKKRFLRIYPGLIFAGLFTVLIIGPITTLLSIGTYFQQPNTFTYIINIFSLNLIDITANKLPGVFALNSLPYIVNASLWTIPIEIGCYLLVAVMGFKKIFTKKATFLYILIVLLSYSLIYSLNKDFFTFFQKNSTIPYSDIIRLFTYFISGVVIYLYKDAISISKKQLFALLIVFLGSAIVGYLELASYFLLPIFVIFIAMTNIDFFKKITQYGDFSYGFYLFAFPIQQAVSYFSNGRLSFFEYTTIAFLLTLVLAIFSYKFIEKPFLKLKDFPFIKTTKKYYFLLCKKRVR
ncbi:MAG: Acetyltransferase [Candidatus Moranbacteria bacterium GW2011_GWC2_37_73]|nr:MAG: Acetyltransferase [Parcubacteria group bacterium GW2011_GWC1_36_108]KKQ00316.1 MAG: Acetyltransferase [Candidatus Moranbacteria bacterium GW2011_GWD1_36_198]KKQ01379.1 MAG: Acetyltransferase [Candidatus Moranbacteria bacterium GW2011_GWD2_36_198]KKQ39382.1 MAG: Acetyltransferase [Candidatus Moranbacteria bacterium GW2011_GWC2_37_73]HAR99500.1 hypothetical protein [Candidatus Moranbacteria bacterium]